LQGTLAAGLQLAAAGACQARQEPLNKEVDAADSPYIQGQQLEGSLSLIGSQAGAAVASNQAARMHSQPTVMIGEITTDNSVW